jgi:3alpha(or 20beta)-hydroxysteroid dehydrogenase
MSGGHDDCDRSRVVAAPARGTTMNTDLAGRSVVVTGAARGLGAAIARTCHAVGAEVLIADVLHDDAERLAAELGPRARAFRHDVADPRSWAALASDLRATVGRPDVLVNNAGVVRPGPISASAYDDFRHTVDVNLAGAYLGIATFVDLHRELGVTRPGSIVNIASVRGMVGGTDVAGYCASKFGVRGLTKAAAVELGSLGIRVNAVCPGPIDSDMSAANPAFAEMDFDAYVARLPLGRMGRPVDIGEAVAWLASDASAFVTGIDLPVDGGLTATSHAPERRHARAD